MKIDWKNCLKEQVGFLKEWRTWLNIYIMVIIGIFSINYLHINQYALGIAFISCSIFIFIWCYVMDANQGKKE